MQQQLVVHMCSTEGLLFWTMLQTNNDTGKNSCHMSNVKLCHAWKRIRGTAHQPSKSRAGIKMQTPSVHITRVIQKEKKKQTIIMSMHCNSSADDTIDAVISVLWYNNQNHQMDK